MSALALGVLLTIVVMFVLPRLATTAWRLQIEHGHVVRFKGRPDPGLVHQLELTAKDAKLDRVVLEARRERKGLKLVVKDQSDEVAQRFRNVFYNHPSVQ